MDDALQMTFSNAFFFQRNILYSDSNFTECSFSNSPIDNTPLLVLVMVWRRTRGHKPLIQPCSTTP